MLTRDLIIETARDWIGTPYKHHQSSKGVACDCVGFIIGVGKELDYPVPDFPNYYRSPEGNELINKLGSVLEAIDPDDSKVGDVLVFKNNFKGLPHHVGFLSYNNRLIHADMRAGKIVEVNLGFYKKLIVTAFRLRGMNE